MGLQAADLRDMVYDIFEVDSYASKMGDDKNIVTLSFSVKDKAPADDLVRFIEGGYNFVLDSDATAGEQSDGTYKVFVELERDKNVAEHIFEIVEGVKKLTSIDDFKFRYYKNFKSMTDTIKKLKETIPNDPENYGIKVTETNLDNFKNFFSNSFLEESYIKGDTLIMKKAYAEPISFEILDYTTSDNLLMTEAFNVDAYPEILFLTKYIGDYNISKYGDKLVFENQGNALVVKRT